MPRKKIEELIEKTDTANVITVPKKNSTVTSQSKRASKKSSSTITKKTSTKSETTAKKSKGSTSSKVKTSATKKRTTKSTSTTKKETARTSKTTKNTSAKTTTKKSSSTRSSSEKNASSNKNNPKIEVVEYYDLPYRYNQTTVKVLYQTPTTLFVYWDISDSDREKLVIQYGENFFNDTTPVLTVHNDTLHYSFEVEINDFANNWYLHVNDSNCKYAVELGRRPKYFNNEKHIYIPNDYLYVSYSNEIESPNDHVLFSKDMDTVYFKDVKTNIVTNESLTSMSFIRNIGKIYSLFDLQYNYNNGNLPDGNDWHLDFKNPSSANSSSTFK